MVGHKLQDSHDFSHLRKLRKPLIERKRRERINTSIESLKTMLLQSRPEIDNDTKLDKAEILELTVNHLTKKQHRPTVNQSYSQGFYDCSREAIQFLTTTGILDPVTLIRLQFHLQRAQTTPQLNVSPIIAGTRHRVQSRLCSTPEPHTPNSSFPGDVTIATTPVRSHSSVDSIMLSSSSDFSSSASYGNDLSILDNIISEEKPWRPW